MTKFRKLGLIQYHSHLPAGVVWVHASLPAVLWVSLVWSWAAAGPVVATRPASDRAARSTRAPLPHRPAPDPPVHQRETAS